MFQILYKGYDNVLLSVLTRLAPLLISVGWSWRREDTFQRQTSSNVQAQYLWWISDELLFIFSGFQMCFSDSLICTCNVYIYIYKYEE